jgi:hypothetical protein
VITAAIAFLRSLQVTQASVVTVERRSTVRARALHDVRPEMVNRRVAALAVLLACVPCGARAQHHGLPHNIPDFCAASSVRSIGSGSWSDPAIWSPARVPSTDDVVVVSPGTTVSYAVVSDASIACLGIHGTLAFQPSVNTRLKAGTIMVMEGATLEIGTSAAPVHANVTAEIVIADRGLNPGIDPEQFGTGLLAFGTVAMHGAIVSPTFVRLGTEPRAGQTTLTLGGNVSGWRAGDRIVVPDTRQLRADERFANLRPQFEEFTISQIAGNVLTLNRAVTWDHSGARTPDNVLEYLPHVGHLTRNVRIRSENPAGTRGHVLFTHRADVDIRYTMFKDLGRTTNEPLGQANQLGRYPLHIHHVMGPVNAANTGYQFRLIGNAVADSLKWPLTVHNSHFGLIRENVVFNGWGAGFVTEDGNESANEFVHNFGLAIFGDENPRNMDGRDGSIFWFSGFNHVVRDNVAANAVNRSQAIVNGAGFNFWTPAAGLNARLPLFRGADTTVAGEYRVVNMRYVPITEFARNEVYGAMPTGLVVWNLGTDGYNHSTPMAETVVRDFLGWHLHESAFFGYPAFHMTFDGFTVRGQSRALGIHDGGSGWWSGDYKNRDVTIRRANIQGMSSGIDVSNATENQVLIENSYLRNLRSNISVPTLATPGTRATPTPRTTTIRNVRFDPMPGSSQFVTIDMDWDTSIGNPHPQIRDEVFVYAYQGAASDNFRVYYAEQATQNIAGGVAPCTSRRPEIDGLVCPTGGLTLTRPTNLRIVP